jgi:hypothetical protein
MDERKAARLADQQLRRVFTTARLVEKVTLHYLLQIGTTDPRAHETSSLLRFSLVFAAENRGRR